ncbi:hypothetical protein [Methanococcoides sp. FTZ1]|uniref:hypothetical protein n=1 Tax=Methanococcoides sp. FTZ1 TaxID=3439061 RepID=UPI003F8455FA
MTKTQITKKTMPGKRSLVDNNQYSVVGGYTVSDLNAEELDLYRFMLGGLLAK